MRGDGCVRGSVPKSTSGFTVVFTGKNTLKADGRSQTSYAMYRGSDHKIGTFMDRYDSPACASLASEREETLWRQYRFCRAICV
jgi:hypothetical protein